MALNYKQVGLTGLLLVLVVVLEWKAAMGAFRSVAEPTAAFQYAALSVSCALLAFIFSAVAGAMKHDERPHVRGRASLARVVSLACLLIPIGTLASAMKHDRLQTEWPAYVASQAYQIDLRIANDPDVDRADPSASWEQDQARRRIQAPTFTSASLLDFEWWYALFLQSIVITGAGIRLSPPATPEEVRHWRAVAAGKKAAVTRKRNAKRRKSRQAFRLVMGGKK
jgi:hypothetical protein